jgi:hypothetical protein
MILLEVAHYYHEFHPEAVIKQPWNAFSSLIFFLPVLYWFWQLRGQYRKYWVVIAILPLLFLNGVGSTLFHAFNGGWLYMLLDVLPPLIMLVFLTVYLWRRLFNSWIKAGLIVAAFLGINALNMYFHSHIGDVARGVNFFYLVNGLMVLTPMVINLKRNQWKGWQYILLALVFVGIALIFRSLDYPTPNPFPNALPQGTHFLWHISSALAVFPLGRFLVMMSDLNGQSN